jgi:hypothetical protein
MIAPSTGEVSFTDGLRITAHSLIQSLPRVTLENITSHELPVKGWSQHHLGEHPSSVGPFAVEAVTGMEHRVEGVFLSHAHSFYEATTPEDSERRAFHEGIIASDLCGQREFSWGQVFCRLDKRANRDWLIVIYSPFCGVPLHQKEVYRVLLAHETTPPI